MVFKEIIKIWKKENLLKQSLKSVEEMFEHSEFMFKNSVTALMHNTKTEINVYKKDKILNKLEIETRRKIFEHLTINPVQDTAASLILVEVIRDLERIGDFSKNIVEINMMYPKKFGKDKYIKILVDTGDKVFKMFNATKKSFKECDKEEANKIVNLHKDVITKTIDKLIENIMNDKKIKVKEAVAYVLLARYLKRISAHLMNIASSVVNPFHRIRHRGRVTLKGYSPSPQQSNT